MEKDDKVMKLDIDAVVRSRLPRYYRFIPKSLINWLKRTICQDRMNYLLERNHGKEGAEFCHGILKDLDVSYQVMPGSYQPDTANKKVIFVSNHPLGGLDGLALIDLTTKIYGCEPAFLVNDLLNAIKPLQRVFLPINKHGCQNRTELDAIEEAFESDRPVIIFPAGLVSRRQPDGSIADLQWKKMAVNYAKRYSRDIIPLFFDGENSPFFYKFAKRRERLGLKFNIEMIYLPREVFRASGKRFDIYIGHPISHTALQGGTKALQQAAQLRDLVYSLKDNTNNGKDN